MTVHSSFSNHGYTDIALFLPALQGGGAEKTFINLMSGFVDRGYKVDFVLARAEGVYLSQAVSIARVVDLKVRRMAGTFWGLVHYLRRSKPTVILSALGLANFFAVLAKVIAGNHTRVVVSLHSMASFQDRGSIKKRLENQLIRWSFRLANEIVVVSHALAIEASKQSGILLDKIKVVYNPVLSPGLLEQAQDEVDHPFFIPGHVPVILGVGRLTGVKDFATLLRAFAMVRKESPVRLLLLGEGGDRPKLEALARELEIDADVSIPGFVENPYAYMSKANVFVLSSLTEGLPTVLIEAMACGCPVVSTDCGGGAREILNKGKHGFLVPVQDAGKMAQAILSVLGGERKNVDSEWLHQFDCDAVVDQYISVLGLPVLPVQPVGYGL